MHSKRIEIMLKKFIKCYLANGMEFKGTLEKYEPENNYLELRNHDTIVALNLEAIQVITFIQNYEPLPKFQQSTFHPTQRR